MIDFDDDEKVDDNDHAYAHDHANDEMNEGASRAQASTNHLAHQRTKIPCSDEAVAIA